MAYNPTLINFARNSQHMVPEVMKMLSNGKTKKEIRNKLKINQYQYSALINYAVKESNFKTEHQLLADYVKNNWWPGEAERSGMWQVLKEDDGLIINENRM